jgi:hypothetical protein
MQAVRQAAGGLVYGMVSILLVLGSLALALAQRPANPAAPTASKLPNSPTTTPISASATSTPTSAAASPTDTQIPTATSYSFPTVRPPTIPVPTTAVRCGPFYGWVKAYVVEPGDTLYRIAARFSTTVELLAEANCKSDSVIYAGERLWVPYRPTPVAGITIIPTFPTPTANETQTATMTTAPSSTPVSSESPTVDP